MAAEPRGIAFAVLAVLVSSTVLAAAELPSHARKPKHPEAVKHCNVAGWPGVLAANGICVKMSGYVSAGFNLGRQWSR
jgi:hypothetical protein